MSLCTYSELEERARLLKQRLHIKTAAATADAGVPFSDSEVSGHRSRPRDGRKTTSRSGVEGAGGVDSPQRGSAGTWNKTQSGDRSWTTGSGSSTTRHTARSSSSHRHDYQRRTPAGDVHTDRTHRRRGITQANSALHPSGVGK